MLPTMPRALIVGGTGPIGRATARRLLTAGWHVDLTGRDRARLPADISAAGGKFLAADRHDDCRHQLGSRAALQWPDPVDPAHRGPR